MIHSARPTVSPVANIVFTLFCFARFEQWGRMDGRTDNLCENYDPYMPWLWVGRVDQIHVIIIESFLNFRHNVWKVDSILGQAGCHR